MNRHLGWVGLSVVLLGASCLGVADGLRRSSSSSRGLQTLEALSLALPTGWTLAQDARSNQTLLLGLVNGTSTLNFRVKQAGSFNLRSQVVANAVITSNLYAEQVGMFSWDLLAYRYKAAGAPVSVYVKAFTMEYRGYRYYGWAAAESAPDAAAMAREFLLALRVQPVGPDGDGRSLTGVGYVGKKYYLGFGDILSGSMGNEVKYDVAHTHDIFTKNIGGSYLGTKLLGSSPFPLLQKWSELKNVITKDDMYVQYSSGHGSVSGLQYGVSYDQIRDNALSYPASEMVLFIMACHSGGLVDSFNRKKSVWQNWQQEGRTLLVFASSRTSELSHTGPGTDSEEPGGPSGSAGSAFGHALWKALIGHADGFVDGMQDGWIALGEIVDYTSWKTNDLAGHHPVKTGTYQPTLVMNRVPTAAELARFEGGSEGLDDEEIRQRIEQLDAELRIR